MINDPPIGSKIFFKIGHFSPFFETMDETAGIFRRI
jgi:hypothetical protein